MRMRLRALGFMAGVMLSTMPAVQAAQSAHGDVNFGVDHGDIRLKDKAVVVHVKGQADEAKVGADGRVWLGSNALTLSDEAQAGFRDYHRAVVALNTHAVAIGAAGAKFGLQTVGEVFAGLLTGKAEQAGERAEARGAAFKQQVLELCQRMDTVRVAQQAAVDLAPVFAPYAVLTQKDVDDCAKDVKDEKSHAPS